MKNSPTNTTIDHSWSRRVRSALVSIHESSAAAPRRRALAIARTLVIHGLGTAILSVGVALLFWNDFGPGPLDVLIGGVRNLTGLPLAVALWVTFAVLIGVVWMLGRRPGVGTIVTPLVLGPLIQWFLAVLEPIEPPGGWLAKIGIQLLAIAVIGIGAGAVIASGLGAGLGELLSAAAADRSGQPEPLVRVGFELTWIALGLLLGGPFGLGTLIIAVAIGPAVRTGQHAVDHTIDNATELTRRQLARV